MEERGLEPLEADDAIYINKRVGKIAASYVDYFLLIGPGRGNIKK